MKNQALLKRIVSIGITLILLTGCAAPATQLPTIEPPPPGPTAAVTPSPTVLAKSTLSPMEKIWDTNGSTNAFYRPTELALDSQGNIYIVDGGNQRVQKFDKDGNFILMWGGPGAGDGQFLFNVPPAHYGCITVDKDDYVYVTDHHNRVQKFDSDGNFLMKFGETGYEDGEFAILNGVAVDVQGNIYTTDWSEYEIQKFNSKGEFLQKWEVPSCKPGGTSSPYNVVLDDQGQLYIGHHQSNCIQKFDGQGNLLQQWGDMGKENGQFSKPLGIALDAQGNIYVADNGNNRIQKFDANGNFLAAYGPFDYPVGIAVDHEGYVYVVEIVLGRLQKLRLQ